MKKTQKRGGCKCNKNPFMGGAKRKNRTRRVRKNRKIKGGFTIPATTTTLPPSTYIPLNNDIGTKYDPIDPSTVHMGGL